MKNQIAINGQKSILENHLNKAVENGYKTIKEIKEAAKLTFKTENKNTILTFNDYQEVFKTYFN